MFALTRIRTGVARLTVGALAISLLSAVGVISGATKAQAATTVFINDTDAPLAFVKATPVMGTNFFRVASAPTRSVSSATIANAGMYEGDIVLYKGVGTYGGVSVDAVVTTLPYTGSITVYDNPGSASTANGAANNWMINTSGGEAKFRFEFFKSGTYTGENSGIQVILQNVKLTSIDLDCSSAAGSYQYTDATGFQKYSMMSPTNLAVKSMASPARVRFIANKAGSRSSVPEDQVMLKYDAIHKVELSFGNVIAGSTNYFGLVFGGWPNGGATAPVEYTNIFNTPPTSNGTTLNAATGDSTTVSISNFGIYGDLDNNPFLSVKIGTIGASGTLEYFSNGSWGTVTSGAGTVIPVADIEAGKLRFNNPSGTPSIQFWVFDGLDYSTNSYLINVNPVASSQRITFSVAGPKSVSTTRFASGATSSQGLTVELISLTPGICAVVGLEIEAKAAGTCVIVAKQPGTSSVSAAEDVQVEFQVVSGAVPTTPQTITFSTPDSMTVGVSSYTTNAISTSSLTVALISLTPSLCTVNGLTVQPVAAGNCKIEASQAGNGTYLPADKVTLTIPVNAVAGGGTAPGVRTTGPVASLTDTKEYLLTGRLDTNGYDTLWQFCYLKVDSPNIDATTGELKGNPTCKNALGASNQTSTLVNNGSNDREVTYLAGNLDGTYHYQLVGRHTSGGKIFGNVWKFKGKSRPYLRTNAASSVGNTAATLNGEVKTSSSNSYSVSFCFTEVYKVKAGTTGQLDGCETVASSPSTVTSSSFVSLTSDITLLRPSTKYHYQVITKRTNNGSTTYVYGNIVQFITGSPERTATTGEVTGITSVSAVFNGSVNANLRSTTAKICISETFTVGTLSGLDCVTGGFTATTPSSITGSSGTSVSYQLNNPRAGVRYYYQVMADAGGAGSAYGAIKSFVYGAPTAVTLSATDVTNTSGSLWAADINGFINANGGTATNYFCFAETNTVTSGGAMTQCVTGGGSIALETATVATTSTTTSIMLSKTNLNQGTRYYFQAIGRNLTQSPSLDSFGDVMSFLTAFAPTVTTEPVLDFGIETATVRGTLTANGLLTTGAFCISSNALDPSDDDGYLDSCVKTINVTTPSSTSGSGVAITGLVQGLSQATTYYYQAMGTNDQGTGKGEVRSFTTLAGAPVATTLPVTNLANRTATINGRVNPGGASTTVKFCWQQGSSSFSSNCTLTSTIVTLAASAGLTSASYNLTNLTEGLTYYYQIQGTNSQGTTYGEILSFVAGAPTATTSAATGITSTAAVLNGSVKANYANISSVVFCLSDAATTTNGALTCNQPSSPGTYNGQQQSVLTSVTNATIESATVSGLTPGATYYFQIQATAGSNTSYGAVLSFTTGAPIATTLAATLITSGTARLNGTINRVNDLDTTGTICLSDSDELDADGIQLADCKQTLAIDTSQFLTNNGDDAIYVDASDLVSGNTYFFQVLARGATVSSAGEVFSFSTGYAVTFLANGGSGTMNDQSGTTASSLTLNAFSKSGSTFAGWSRTSSGSVAYANGATYDFTANLTLYALWTAIASTPTTTDPERPIVKEKLKLSWANPSPINFGTPLGGGQLNASTNFPSVCSYSPAAGSILAPGKYTLSVTCTPVDGSLYEPVSGTVTLEVKKVKGKPRIVWFNPSPITNPTPLSGTQLNAVASVPGTYEYNPAAGTVLAQGRHKLNVKFSPSNKDDNEEIEANVTIDVLAPKTANDVPAKPSETSTASAPIVAPIKPASAPDTRTATTPALKPTLKTDGVAEVVTIKPNEEKTGIIVSSENWSLQIKSTTQFVQGTVEDTSARVVIEKGNTVTTSGTGFKPLSQVDVYVYSTPTWLGAVVTDEFGNFTTTLPMPNSLPEGDHTFQAQGLTPDDKARTAAVPITLVPATIVNKPGSMRFEVYFGMNSVVITKAEKAKTARMIKIAKGKIASGAKVSVEISGWVQPNPNPGNVKFLSTNRAKNVRDLVQSLGLKGTYTLKYPGLEKDNIPSARHASVIIKWSKSK